MPGSQKLPAGWPGWPNEKKFAVVLTHDVEGKAGLGKCLPLMQLEKEMGFRSTFNLIPEGSYSVPQALREELSRNGFEVGVHDLRHDGRLFSSAAEFRRRAVRINVHLRDWGAVGFRSGFMLRNLDWAHQLDIRYDLSTFDTDPFEPDPHGHGTIFPFWVTRPAPSAELGQSLARDRGYVELPYTLPQDSTLFLLLKEQGPAIWLKKLDWIAKNGGMALVNVHPDYLSLGQSFSTYKTYPVAYYKQFLSYLREKYSGQYWQPLARDMAAYTAGLKVRPTKRLPRRICMVSYSSYLSDGRVMRYAQTLAARGDTVDVFSIRDNPASPRRETVDGVNVFLIQDRFGKTERSKLAYFWPLLRFLAIASSRVTLSHLRKAYDLLHVHNIPDFVVYSAWYPRLTNVPVILDIHDILPELFASKFGISNAGFTYSLIRRMEKQCATFATHVIIANDLWHKEYTRRTDSKLKCTSFINNVDTNVFVPSKRRRDDGKRIILFPGGLQRHQGVDIAIRAFQRVRKKKQDVEFHIYGDGSEKQALVDLTYRLGLTDSVHFFPTKPLREIAQIMGDADLGVVPKRADSFGNEAYSTKIMEFMASGVPVVISSTKIDRHYFNDAIARFFTSGDSEQLAEEMLDLLDDRAGTHAMAERALAYARQHCWNTKGAEYLNLVESLCAFGRVETDLHIDRDKVEQHLTIPDLRVEECTTGSPPPFLA
jgi:glycosyltransferase involved in cell wall biosynthesis